MNESKITAVYGSVAKNEWMNEWKLDNSFILEAILTYENNSSYLKFSVGFLHQWMDVWMSNEK